jgi:CBS domain-containing membrane protein
MIKASSFLPNQSRIAPAEIARASVGAGLGIVITALLSSAWFGLPGATPLLIAPMGASAVLLFAVPASPLAQPYAFMGGHLIAAFVGVAIAQLIPDPVIAASLAVAGAIMGMSLLRCMHPPSGAVALTAVLGGAHVHAAGYAFVLIPVMLNSVLLLIAALAYNNITRRTYPHIAHPVVHPHATTYRSKLETADFERVIADYGETLAVGADDLEKLFNELIEKSLERSA